MKKLLMTTAAALTLVAPAWAQADLGTLDTDGDGMVSYEELQAASPDITPEQFAAIDTDGDGMLNADELSAAQTAGEEAPAE